MPKVLVRDFRRIQVDLFGERKSLLISEYDIDGEAWFLYSEEFGTRMLTTKNGKLNYIQFLRELEKNGRST